MESAPAPCSPSTPLLDALTAAPPVAKSVTPPPSPQQPEIITAWPRCAQLAGAFLLGGLATLLGLHALSYLPQGAEPSKLYEAHAISYRVDLNEASRAELLQLPGIGPALADRIEHYRQTSGGFRSVEDLRKVSGIGPAKLEQVRPFVTVKSSEGAPATEVPSKSTGSKIAGIKESIDINQATLSDLQKLPGIGPKLSQRIVDERERRPFTSVEELRRVAGIGPKTLEKVRPYVSVK
jgi:competence protein ComEA